MNRSVRISLLGLAAATGISAYWINDHQLAYMPRPEGGGRDAAGAAEWQRLIRSNVETGEIEPGDYLRMRKAADAKLASQGKSLGLNWIEMGPDNVGGRTRSITVDPSDASGNTIWAGGVTGGLWKSLDGANTWENVSGFNENLIVSSIAFLGNGHLYVATGPSFDGGGGTGGSGSIGAGLFKSDDGGGTFTLVIGPTIDWNEGADWAYINKIAADPLVSDGLWVGGNMGFKHYTESGGTFTVPTGISATANCRALEVSSDGQVIVAGINSNQAFISINGGGNFAQASQGSTAGRLPSTGVDRMEFAVSPDDHNYIYALQSNGGRMNGVFVSQSAGQGDTWQRIWPAGFGTGGVPTLDIFGDNKQGWYDNVIAVRPGTNSEEVWVGGVSLWKTTLDGAPQQIAIAENFDGCFVCVHADVHEITFADNNLVYVGCDGGVFKSTAGGLLWGEHDRHYNVTQFYSMAFSPKGKVLGGTQDNGTQYIQTVSGGPEDAQEVFGGDGFDCEISQLDPDIMFATVYNGALGRSQDNGQNFSGFYDQRLIDLFEANDGDLGDFYTNIALFENFNDQNSPYTTPVHYVLDGDLAPGASVTITYHGGALHVPQYYTYTNTGGTTMPDSTVLDLVLPDRVTSLLAVGFSGSAGIWVTRSALNFNDSAQWWKVENAVGNVNCLAWSNDGNHLFYGDGNVIHRVSGFNDAYDFDHADVSGASFALTTAATSLGAVVTGIAPDKDPFDGNRLMVTLGQYGGTGKVRLSTNATTAMTFSNIWNPGTGLTGMPVFDGVIMPGNDDIMVVGTEYGVMATDDGGSTWTFENTGMARVPTFTVRQQTMTWNTNPYGPDYVTNQWVIYAGTHGRGIFRTETLLGMSPGAGSNVGLGDLTVFPNPVDGIATLGFALNDRKDVSVNVFDMDGRLVFTRKPTSMAPGAQRLTLDASSLEVGAYVVELTAGTDRRTTRFVVQR